MFILMGVIASIIISAIQIFAFCKKRTVGNCINIVLKNGFAINLISLALLKYVFKYKHFIVTDAYGPMNFFKFFALSMVVGVVLLFIYSVVNKILTFEEENAKKGAGPMTLKIVSLVLFFLGSACFFGTVYGKGSFGDVAADELFITLFSPTAGTDPNVYIEALEGPIFQALLLTTIFGIFVFSNFKLVYHNKEKAITVFNDLAHRIISIVLAALFLVSGIVYGVQQFRLVSLYNAYFAKSTVIDKNYVDPRTADIKFPEKKRNLIHIYLESMENSYMSKDLGGFMDENLIPELTELAEEGYTFSHKDSGFGGPQSATGTTWSVASMINMTTGLPMKAPTEPNSYGTKDNFLPGAYTLGDILHEQGYEQTLMFGADADFGGLTYYYQSHGDFKIMDYKFAKENGLIPPDYYVWWGYEDDKLFDFAKDEITRLYETGKPFNFTMETADTHRPDGYIGENTPTPYPNPYANAVAYSSSEVEKFVRWIQKQPFYEDTTIVIIGDHLSMETNFFDYYGFDDSYQRSQYNVILNPAPGVASRDKDILFNRIYANFDMFPTILTCLGAEYNGERLGIGTDLFSGEKTIFEEKGFDHVNKELEKKSKLYNERILIDPNKEETK